VTNASRWYQFCVSFLSLSCRPSSFLHCTLDGSSFSPNVTTLQLLSVPSSLFLGRAGEHLLCIGQLLLVCILSALGRGDLFLEALAGLEYALLQGSKDGLGLLHCFLLHVKKFVSPLQRLKNKGFKVCGMCLWSRKTLETRVALSR
jgi:hypothetical protein